MTTLSYNKYEIKPPVPFGTQHSATLSVPVNILLDNLRYFNFSESNSLTLRNPYEVNTNMEFLKRVNNPFGRSADAIPFLFMAGCHVLYITADESFSFYK